MRKLACGYEGIQDMRKLSIAWISASAEKRCSLVAQMMDISGYVPIYSGALDGILTGLV